MRASVVRGGSSRGVFVRLDESPPAGPDRDALVIALIGASDPSHVDGLGGGRAITSKVCVVGPAIDDPEADVHYQVGNVAIDHPVVDWRGTCGNLTAAAPLYALDEGLVAADPAEPTAVRLRNLSTGGLVLAEVGPRAERSPSGVAVSTEYLAPGASVLDEVLPLGAATSLRVDGREIAASLVDVTHPYLLVRAHDVLTPDEWEARGGFKQPTLDRLERVRAAAAAAAGLVTEPSRAATASPGVPRLVLLGAGSDRADLDGVAISMGHAITSVPMTAAMCLAAARMLPGTLAHELSPDASGTCRVRGPISVTTARARVGASGDVLSTSVDRTARIVMRGEVEPA